MLGNEHFEHLIGHNKHSDVGKKLLGLLHLCKELKKIQENCEFYDDNRKMGAQCIPIGRAYDTYCHRLLGSSESSGH